VHSITPVPVDCKQSEYKYWCLRNVHIFASLDASKVEQCKADLQFASGGNPLLLNSFCREFEIMVRIFVCKSYLFMKTLKAFALMLLVFGRWVARLHPALMFGSRLTTKVFSER
jgi:hypothetical protein